MTSTKNQRSSKSVTPSQDFEINFQLPSPYKETAIAAVKALSEKHLKDITLQDGVRK